CCYQFKNVVSLTHLRGEWHLEFVLSAKNEKEVAQFVKGLKTQFASHLINVNSAQQTAHIDQSLARICRMVERAEVEPKLAQNVRRM
ncbi:MAG: hypothetical protein KDD70_19015, partial [Bdellovibrionales bacterium]|nr:hypothetical protein [Bdellovibrionales bacterium]